ncbi:UDP-glucose 4-epimerase GalE [Stenotrophomonas pigmentata]|uniref:UDP-glucose 4-epimerase GalE n=1 Tax=Stenotrophomonas pigmentata TaxID=3055080 RepID=UPI0026E972E4|nr:UDP-glucose 4-epimerase GalE [Stenotrophomonas sp. 610A2]
MILVTGGTGYIGSHASLVLHEAGHEVVLLDNLSNSSRSVLDRLAALAGKSFRFVEGDIRDEALLTQLFSEYKIDGVMHFAGLKSVAESVGDPLKYFDNNVAGTRTLLGAMSVAGVYNMVFSSSATVYDGSQRPPFAEDAALGASNPYGNSKAQVETLLNDVASADPSWSFALLRYFNPVGGHESGLLGENPRGVPNNLMPYICQVASGVRDRLTVHGDDYPTIDGTGVRDFIHVMDLADGHVAALAYCLKNNGVLTANLGTGMGTSVIQLIETFERVTGNKVPFQIGPRRAGDVAESWADAAVAERVLGWRARLGLPEMCRDSWMWQSTLARGEA